jgi:threonine dehydratase/serine racemase
MPDLVSIADVMAAADRIRPYIRNTPVVTSSTVNAISGAAVFFKCENLQKVGAFKARGAVNAVLSLTDDGAGKGVVTHSSGNHGQALAYAASIRDVPCTVVMPDDAPAPKVEAVEGYGATIVFCPQLEREETAARILEESGGVFVHPFDDARVIAGQGTAALELIEEVPGLDAIITPVGGGGLMSGTAIVVRDRLRRARLIGAEPRAADDAHRSLASGELQPAVADPQTLADGLRMGLSELTFAHLQQLDVEVVTVDESAIADSARFHLERMKLVVEPSGATALAALRRLDVSGKRVGVILSGGNTDFGWLSP